MGKVTNDAQLEGEWEVMVKDRQKYRRFSEDREERKAEQ